MKARHFILLSVLACIASAAWAAPPPKSASYVDPGAPCFRWPAVDYDADGVFDRIDHCTNTPAGCTVDKWGCELDADGDGVCDGRDQCPDTPSGTKVDKDGCPPGARAAKVQEAPKEVTPPPPPPAEPPPLGEKGRQLVETGRLRLENVFFESGSATLLPESEDELGQLGAALERFPDVKLEIQGHTDTRGSASGNMRLSQARAEAVRSWLLSHHHGIHSENLTAKGYGETQPETKERNQEELLRNRRVELRLLNPEVLPHNVKVEHPR
jgi:outer membrane protein OmpA-like peptidoglycan-associated protein